jgi:hypothetical protein
MSNISPAPQISPAPTPLEAAAIVAAIDRFARDSAPPPRPATRPPAGGWLRAARTEAVGRLPGPGAASTDWHPWRDAVRAHPR